MENLNFPNLLTLLRIGLIPIWALLFWRGDYLSALLIFLFAGLTDFMDGLWARHFKSKTKLGAILDPVADKLLMIVGFLTLGFSGWIPIYLTFLVIIRDIYIVIGFIFLSFYAPGFAISPTKLSKYNTFFQLALLFVVLFSAYQSSSSSAFLWGYFHFTTFLSKAFIFIVSLMTVLTTLQYTYVGWKIFKRRGLEDASISDKKS